MTQLELFGDAIFEKLAREDDPPTCKAAAEDIKPKLSGLREAFVLALADLGGGPATAREIGERAKEMGLVRETESVRKRSAELERLNLVQVVGVQRCRFTNKLAEAYRLNEFRVGRG